MITHPRLHQLAADGVKLGLERVESFLRYLGEPHAEYPVVHIGGTNGKGSVVSYLTSTLKEAGYRVGTYTSPHLQHVNDRMCINGFPISDSALNEGIEELDRRLDEWLVSNSEGSGKLTYYEFVTILAFMFFAKESIDIAVIEVGMGGRLDATNVVSPVATGIVTIGLDHTEQLGNSIASIAAEKAGIVKRGAGLVLGSIEPEAREVIESMAKLKGVTVWRPGHHLFRECRDGQWHLKTPEGSVSVVLRMLGEHQGHNALVAFGILHQLKMGGFPIDDNAITVGLSSAKVPGRLDELIPNLFVDGAHNVAASEALARWMARQPRPANRILLLGMGGDRDPVAFVKPLLPYVDEVVTTRCAHPKAMGSLALAESLQSLDVLLADGGSIEEALREVCAEADQVIVTGSLYLVGAAISLVADGVVKEVRRPVQSEI